MILDKENNVIYIQLTDLVFCDFKTKSYGMLIKRWVWKTDSLLTIDDVYKYFSNHISYDKGYYKLDKWLLSRVENCTIAIKLKNDMPDLSMGLVDSYSHGNWTKWETVLKNTIITSLNGHDTKSKYASIENPDVNVTIGTIKKGKINYIYIYF